MRKSIKRSLLSGIKAAGLFHLIQRSHWRRNHLAILCYHGISLDDEHAWDPAFYMTPAAFESRLRLLKERGYNVLPLGEGLKQMYAGDLPPKSVAITFDDGCFDFYRHAFRSLREYGYPATVYMTTFYSDYNRPVFPMFCGYLLWKGRKRLAGAYEVLGYKGQFDFSDSGRGEVLRAVSEFAAREGMSVDDKHNFMRRIAESVGVDFDEIAKKRILHIMNPAEAAEVAKSGNIRIELHTHRHRTPEDEALLRREIEDNRECIHRISGSTATHFCYPSGVYSDRMIPWLRSFGVESATTCLPGLANRGDDPFVLPRVTDTSNLSPMEFESWVAGVSTRLLQRLG